MKVIRKFIVRVLVRAALFVSGGCLDSVFIETMKSARRSPDYVLAPVNGCGDAECVCAR